MKITPYVFDAYLKCPTKCWLRATGESSDENPYAEWVKTRNAEYREIETARLVATTPSDEVAITPQIENTKTASWRMAVNLTARTNMESDIVESEIHMVERVPATGRGKAAQLTPIRFVFTNKLGKDDKLLLAFDAAVLSKELKRDIPLGKIIHGDDHATLKVKTSALAGEVHNRLGKIATLISNPTPPDLILNRHCAECEFQARCRMTAMETDDLSLLTGMSVKERNKLRSKGIFSVTQLSYTFRPRRTPKRSKNPAKPHHYALQALAIRENSVYIHGTPEIPTCANQVYLDVEGIPDRDNYYLIGVLVVTENRETFHSFWADTESDQSAIFLQMADVITRLPDFRIYHYGEYDASAIKRVATALPDGQRQKFDAIIEKSVNVLSLVYPHVYFPTYSNSLKEVEKHLDYDRSVPRATGLESIIWRYEWEKFGEQSGKDRILQYNHFDCLALKHLSDFIIRHTKHLEREEADVDSEIKVSHTQEMIDARPHWSLFCAKKYAMIELDQINKCAYFDYQREKVLVRTHQHFKAINKRHRKLKQTNLRPDETLEIEVARCAKCGSRKLEPIKETNHLLVDLKFLRTGVKKWVKDIRSYRYRCLKCGSCFSSENKPSRPKKYGPGLSGFALYLNIGCGLNMGKVTKVLGDVFKIHPYLKELYNLRGYTVKFYASLYENLLRSTLESPVIHIDETTVHLSKGRSGYVWVITGADRVYYTYRPTRESAFLEEILSEFSGVLVSDFYSGYDCLDCAQQKCLAHFVRDIDDDLLKNPWDLEFKGLASEFGSLLLKVIQTVDRYGLKKRHLHKHKGEVLRFLDSVASRKLTTDLALRYQKRFQKSGSKMFTFLDHDGVPWNNNNAEHAIKRFAKHRRDGNGKFTETSLREYLVLASIFETCEFNNVNILDFLLSKETTLGGLFRLAGRKSRQSSGFPSTSSGTPPDASLVGFFPQGLRSQSTAETDIEL